MTGNESRRKRFCFVIDKFIKTICVCIFVFRKLCHALPRWFTFEGSGCGHVSNSLVVVISQRYCNNVDNSLHGLGFSLPFSCTAFSQTFTANRFRWNGPEYSKRKNVMSMREFWLGARLQLWKKWWVFHRSCKLKKLKNAKINSCLPKYKNQPSDHIIGSLFFFYHWGPYYYLSP